jgi:ketol-acid reductoisomerase
MNILITKKPKNMAKFEIVKETSFTGDVLYYIEKEGIYIMNSASSDLAKVEDYLHTIITNNEQETFKESIKTIEIKNENETN